ncbi:hypothetical protein [Nonomuraea angiospora]|uniref:hypothetical protein n=1 Tax=Nonomuraea angiospora TaxID=46172 RepID=UPI0029ABA5A3|nr:hypothetical protein [Nonomuraea angiospora]MDX3108774.1 hypothetical protein [Nonomuraea angiospora]
MLVAVAAAIGMSACAGKAPEKVDTSPLSAAYAPPFICNYVPKAAVEQMTGVRDPLATGSLNPAVKDRPAIGACSIFQNSGDKPSILRITLDTAGSRGQINEQLQDGSKPLPPIVPDGVGYYVKDANMETRVGSVLVRGKERLGVELVRGVKGRDNEADVVALMKLIAPKLIVGTGTPPPETKD